ncbi:hypothetical protein J4Q44_G00008620 [Coregonus suidteri]|uniref:Pentraxin (PTX) domain-containing protein n=1 Tax=Coregonus suidteri TaxID=861788 RepID=A0AAN8MDG4_9TELE
MREKGSPKLNQLFYKTGKMERLFLVHVLFTMCWAVPQDLAGKMFTFPKESDSDHVRLMPTGENYSSVTVCLRYFTDVKRAFSIFSMATPTSPNDFLLFKESNGDMELNCRLIERQVPSLGTEEMATWLGTV